MANFNKVILLGNLTRDPQLKYLPNQMAVVDIGLAVNHRYKTASGEDREDVLFIDCTAFGKQAEVINTYCTKGRPLLVEGRLKLDTWDDKQSGQKRSKHKVTIENFQLLGGRQDGAPGGASSASGENQQRPNRAPSRPAPAPAPDASAPPPAEQPFPDEQQFKEDDIPF